MLILFIAYAALGSKDFLGSTIVDVGGPPDGSAVLFRSGTDGQWIAQQWTSAAAFTDLSISAAADLGGVTGTAWLTNAIGGGATTSNVLETNSFNSPGSGMVTFFRDLVLQPGPYFFVIDVEDGIGGWTIAISSTVSTDPAVSYGGFVFCR